MSIKARTVLPYPYDIPPPPTKLDTKKFSRRDLWNALEFFRTEALLRSKVVWTLYKEAPSGRARYAERRRYETESYGSSCSLEIR